MAGNPTGNGDFEPWPDGVKLDTKIDGSQHKALWVMRWDAPQFTSWDFYAHKLHMNQADGTFLMNNGTIALSSDIPGDTIFFTQEDDDQLRLTWYHRDMDEIEAGKTYTVSFASTQNITPVDEGAEDIEAYGIWFCENRFCPLITVRWCSLIGRALTLFNNQHPSGIFPLNGTHAECHQLTFVFLPLIR